MESHSEEGKGRRRVDRRRQRGRVGLSRSADSPYGSMKYIYNVIRYLYIISGNGEMKKHGRKKGGDEKGIVGDSLTQWSTRHQPR